MTPSIDQPKRDLLFREESESSPSPSQGQSWFLGIGINQYQYFSNLNNAVKDVQDMANLLQRYYGLKPKNKILLFDEEASRKNIITHLDKLIGLVNSEDKLIIYYSGHGHLNSKTQKGYWIPTDANPNHTAQYIRNSTIRDYLEDISSLHSLLISDSCFSGTLFVRTTRSSLLALEDMENRPSRWAICSGRHDEEVFDGTPGTNSPFAASILDVLSRNQLPKLNVAKLADKVVELTRANYKQLPEGSPLFGVGHKGGQYVFCLKNKKYQKIAADPIPAVESKSVSTHKQAASKMQSYWFYLFVFVPLLIWGSYRLPDLLTRHPINNTTILIKERSFSEGLKAIAKNGNWGFIDESGKVHIPFRYKAAGNFQEGLAMVYNGDKWGYIDKAGNEVIPLQYHQAGDFNKGKAPVVLDHYLFSIDTEGDCVEGDCPGKDQQASAPPEKQHPEKLQQAKNLHDDHKTWEQASTQDTYPAYKKYLKDFPNGQYSSEAKNRIEQLVREFKGAILKAEEIQISTLKTKSSGKSVKTKLSKLTDRLHICIMTATNININPGFEKVYIRIMDTEGRTLGQNNHSDIIINKINGEAIPYSQSIEFEYQQDGMELCSYWKPPQPLTEGVYRLEVYHKGFFVDKGEFSLN